MKERKTTHHVYAAWNFDRELADLNAESEKGWQLVRGGSFRNQFRFDDSVCYRYALDYNMRIDDDIRYRELFREQGWEYVSSTFNGWHYFRKVYDPSLPEAEYIIYTDEESEQEMKKRWSRLAYTLGGMLAVLFLVYAVLAVLEPDISLLCYCVGFLIGSIALLSGGKTIRAASQRGAGKKRTGIAFVLAMLLLFAVGLVFGVGKIRWETYTVYDAKALEVPWIMAAEVKLPDFYRLALSADATSEVEISLTDEAGAVLRSFSGKHIDEAVTIFLAPGSYRIQTAYRPGAAQDDTGTFAYQWS